jgi:hypothetical protein
MTPHSLYKFTDIFEVHNVSIFRVEIYAKQASFVSYLACSSEMSVDFHQAT